MVSLKVEICLKKPKFVWNLSEYKIPLLSLQKSEQKYKS